MDIVVAASSLTYAIGQKGDLPWDMIRDDMRRFKSITSKSSNGKINAVIMGRLTWESIPEKRRPLVDRINVILSRKSCDDANHDASHDANIVFKKSLSDALLYLSHMRNLENIFIIGGESDYNEAIKSGMVKRIYLTKVYGDYPLADRFFMNDKKLNDSGFKLITSEIIESKESISGTIIPKYSFEQYDKINLDEIQYIDILRELVNGDERADRTGTGTLSTFGKTLEFDMRAGVLPMLTTKKVFFKGVLEELLWFIKGDTNSKRLEEKGVRIWEGNTSRYFLDQNGFEEYPEGQIGPLYGFNWRFWGAEYKGMDHDYRGEGIDQLKNAINLINEDPTSRRILVSAWNVSVLKEGVLPPCHVLFQFYVNQKDMTLSCQTYQRSVDWMLGCPFNITSYALLTHMVAHITGLMPGKLRMCFGDTHLYKNHLEGAQKQLDRNPRVFPKLSFKRKVESIDHFVVDDFEVIGYEPYPGIKLPMSA